VCFLLAAAAMAWYGPSIAGPGAGLRFIVIYWAVFVLFILLALYMALLDLKYIRLQYHLAERELYEQTLGSPSFRQALQAAEEAKKSGPPPPDNGKG